MKNYKNANNTNMVSFTTTNATLEGDVFILRAIFLSPLEYRIPVNLLSESVRNYEEYTTYNTLKQTDCGT